MKVLLIKLTSLGDVIHTLPAAHDLVTTHPEMELHWAVDAQFASVLRSCPWVHRIHSFPLRRLGLRLWHPDWRDAIASFRQCVFDVVIDAQGLTKSALVSCMSRLGTSAERYALAHQTDGSSYEAPTRWVSDVAIDVPRHVHAVDRSRLLCAQSLRYALPAWPNPQKSPWLRVQPHQEVPCQTVALVHGTSRADKSWPLELWLELITRLNQSDLRPALLHGNADEAESALRLKAMAAERGVDVVIWPRCDLQELTCRLAACRGVVGVDGGVSHMAVALGLPHVQIYNFDTAWRTGPLHGQHQRSVYASPHPSIDAVWIAWQSCLEETV